MSQVVFPPVEQANEDGLLCLGGDLSVATLVSAYQQGIFPWYSEGQPILWWSPNPRLVLYPDKVKVSRSLAKTMRNKSFKVTCNTAFDHVIEACAKIPRKNENISKDGTWITDDMMQAYINLHQAGYAHSIEVWQNDDLVGGLYGVALGKVFFGESMFARVSDASKIALVTLCNFLKDQDFAVIDCQVTTDHLLSLGACEIARTEFAQTLSNAGHKQDPIEFTNTFELWSAINRQEI